jgi:hypothetical protein
MAVAEYLREAEVAERYAIGLRQLRLMRMRGTGPRYIKPSGRINRPGGPVRYSLADIEMWIASLPSGGGKKEQNK